MPEPVEPSGGFLAPPPPPRPFVGRAAEFEQLETAAYGHTGFGWPVVILGEAGVGKTSLAAELIARNSQRHSAGRCGFMSGIGKALCYRSSESCVIDLSNRVSQPWCSMVQTRSRTTGFMDLYRRIIKFKLVRSLVVSSRVDLGLRSQREILVERFSTRCSNGLDSTCDRTDTLKRIGPHCM